MKITVYNTADFIGSPEMAAAYLAASLEEKGVKGLLEALGDVDAQKA